MTENMAIEKSNEKLNGELSTNTNLQKAQEINRLIMKKIHSLCKKYNITYFYDAGSLIGAIRHKSFIPWDDDIDLVFTRKEYEKLLKIPRDEWGTDFELVSSNDIAPGAFLDFVNRVFYLKDSIPQRTYDKVKDKLSPKYKNKMCIDLFILDSAFDNQFRQRLLQFKLFYIYGQAMGHRSFIDYKEYSFIKRIIISFLAKIGRRKNLDSLINKYTSLSKSGSKHSKSYFYSNYPITYIKNTFSKEWFASTIPVQVDDDFFDAPIGYDNILTNIYGNYMEFPPEESRKPKHLIME